MQPTLPVCSHVKSRLLTGVHLTVCRLSVKRRRCCLKFTKDVVIGVDHLLMLI